MAWEEIIGASLSSFLPLCDIIVGCIKELDRYRIVD